MYIPIGKNTKERAQNKRHFRHAGSFLERHRGEHQEESILFANFTCAKT